MEGGQGRKRKGNSETRVQKRTKQADEMDVSVRKQTKGLRGER